MAYASSRTIASKTEFAGNSASVQTRSKGILRKVRGFALRGRSTQPSADSGIIETRRRRVVRIVNIPSVDQNRRCHHGRQLLQIELAELRPFGHHNDSVGIARAIESRFA